MYFKIITNDVLLGCAAINASAKITSFFSKLPKDAPRLAIQWTAAEPRFTSNAQLGRYPEPAIAFRRIIKKYGLQKSNFDTYMYLR